MSIITPIERLHDILLESDVDVSDFSDSLGISDEELSLILEGEKDIDMNIAQRLAYLTNTSINDWVPSCAE